MASWALIGSQVDTNSGTKTASGAVAQGDLPVIVVAHTAWTGTQAPTDDNPDGEGIYTLLESRAKATGADTLKAYVRNSLIRVPDAGTVFTHAPGATTGGGIVALNLLDMWRAGAGAKVKSGGQDNLPTANTPAPAWTGGGSASGTNPLLGALFQGNTGGGTKPASFDTERVDTPYSTPSAGLQVVTDDTGNTDSTVTWGAVTGGAQSADLIVEFDARALSLVLRRVTPRLAGR